MTTLTDLPLLDACDDPALFDFDLWPRQRELLAGLVDSRISVWAVGRRSGKTTIAALVCLWDCLFRPQLDELVRPGETRFAVAIATTHPQARLIVKAARSIVERSPLLAGLMEGSTEDELRFLLPTGARTALCAFPCSSRSGRGWPISCLVMDEAAHFLSETDGPRTADRVWEALVPSTAQFGDAGRVILASTPFGTSGLFADTYNRALAGELSDACAQHATTAEVNPTISAEFLAGEERRDPDSFRAEYMAEFTSSGDAFLDFSRINPDRTPIALPSAAPHWVLGLDPAFSKDPFGYALVGRASDSSLVVGPIGALRAQGDFGGPVDEVAALAKDYGARPVTDQYSSAAVVERLTQKHHLSPKVNTMDQKTKAEIFQSLRSRLYDGSLVLPDHPALINELRRLRTKYSSGQSSVINPRVGGSHGDIAQALALAVHEHTGVKGQGAAFMSVWEAELSGEPLPASTLGRQPRKSIWSKE